ncbi:MAG: permease [Paracholeplasma sp.]|nr:permease [Paracholeplasma sp.]MDY3196561.1 permease [Paracholeplasma sp.]
MKKWMKNKFLIFGILALIALSIYDYRLSFIAIEKTYQQIISMLLIVPPIFILIGLFDVFIEKETVIQLLGKESGLKGLFLSFFLGAFSAGPTIAAFPLALLMMKKGAKYGNVVFFLMVWSTLKLPILIYQVSELGLKLTLIMNLTMLIVFVISSYLIDYVISSDEVEQMLDKSS